MFVIRMFDNVFDWLVDNSPKIRKTILGRYNIEGHWFDAVWSSGDGAVREFGLIRISFSERSFHVNGDLYSPQFNEIGSFYSKFAKIVENKLEYAYERQLCAGKFQQASGLGQYSFEVASTSGIPYSFMGKFFDPELDQQIHLRGIRIQDQDDLSILDSPRSAADPDRGKKIREIVEKYACSWLDQNPKAMHAKLEHQF